jgi:hypothetical protein
LRLRLLENPQLGGRIREGFMVRSMNIQRALRRKQA